MDWFIRHLRLFGMLITSLVLIFIAFPSQCVAIAQPAGGPGWSIDNLHPPLTAEKPDFQPKPYIYREPSPLNLPSDAELQTTVVEGRHYHIKRPPAGAYDPAREAKGARIYENEDEALYFRGTGASGRHSRERLIVRNCTFVIDFEPGGHPGGNFEKWDPRRGAIVVEGYREVLIENCVFVSRATKHDPIRKVIGSVIANYCLKVQINQCYFEGASLGWRGHILVWGGGPTEITNVEIAGARQGTTYAMGGGIWVAHGEKIGWTHGGNPDEMIYPNGPLRIENVHIHDQQGNLNTDGIYVQSIQPYLIRNTRVENWKGQDSLIDVGFRDTFQGFRGKRLINHGAVGVIEHCYFGDGYVKSSVGLAGGLIFRHNVMHDAWIFPYVFDGGSWYVLGNRFEAMTGVIASGRNAQLDGWTPGEGMFARGSKMLLFGNHFANRQGTQLPALFVNNSKNSPLEKGIVADHNTYRFDPMPRHWAIDQALGKQDSLQQWRSMGKDEHSSVGPETRPAEPMAPLALPGRLEYKMADGLEAGLVGPVGVTNPDVREKARRLSAQARDSYDRRFLEIEFEDMQIIERSERLKLAFKPSTYWSGRGTLRIEPQAGQSVSFRFTVPHAGRYQIRTKSVDAGKPTPASLRIDGQVVDEKFNAAAGGNFHGAHELSAGEHVLNFHYKDKGVQRLDRLDLARYSLQQERTDREAEQDARQAELRRQAREAATIRLEAENLETVVASAFVEIYPNSGASGGKYRLFMPNQSGQSMTLKVPVPEAGRYDLVFRTVSQQDRRGAIQLSINGQVHRTQAKIGQIIAFEDVILKAGNNKVQLTFTAAEPPIKVRIDRLDLIRKPATTHSD